MSRARDNSAPRLSRSVAPDAIRQAEDARRAALNLMEDAVQARRALEEGNAALRKSEERLARDLAAAQRLQEFSSRIVLQEDLKQLYNETLEAAQEIMRSDMASLQIVDENENALRLLTSRGLSPVFDQAFELIRLDANTACSVARRLARRVVVPDVEKCDFITGAALEVHGIRAVQSTPLISRGGKMLGMISTHWRKPYDPPQQTLRLLDILARLAADVIERKHAAEALRESEERFRMLADNISQLAWTADTQGQIYWYNHRWYEYTGTTPEAMRGSGWKKALHSDHAERVFQSFQHSLNTGEPWEDTFPLRGKDGEYRWFLSRAHPIHDEAGNMIRWFGTNTDITRQREMETRIKQQAGQLVDESRRKDEFLAMLSHELRSPLAAICSAVQLLRLRERGSEDSVQRQAREVIQRQVANLTKLISDLLEVSRVLSGRIHLNQQIVDINQVIRHAAETVEPLIEQRKHELVLSLSDSPLWANADATRIEEIFINLLNNAAKYTDEGGRIEVHCKRSSGDTAQVRVRDNGMGIDKELLPSIFGLFTQADRSLARSAGGLGIGLSLAQRLVDLHGGTIEARSPPNGRSSGSEFIVKLPLTHAPDPPQPIVPDAETALHPNEVKILIVDDNIDQVTMLTSVLEHDGYSIQSAYTGPDGLKVAQQWRPDIVLLDIGLPGLDGYEVARRLRSDPHTKTTQLIALTGYARDTDISLALEAGFDTHLTKPLDFSALKKLIPHQTTEQTHS